MTIGPPPFEIPRGRARTVSEEDGSRGRSVISPLLKWPGGKGGELGKILAAAPTDFERYFEPFVGGGAVFFSMPPGASAYINDTSSDLISFYAHVQKQDEDLFEFLEGIDNWWTAIGEFNQANASELVAFFGTLRRDSSKAEQRARLLVEDSLVELSRTVSRPWESLTQEFLNLTRKLVPKKIARMRKVEMQRGVDLPLDDVWSNIEGAFKAACYSALRSAYNAGRDDVAGSARQAALFFFLREYAYAAMFRFNGKGEFNVPYGGISYNRKNFASKIGHLRSAGVVERLESATLGCEDFETFLDVHRPGANDFLFLDPPYDSDFSDYDRKGFDREDHERLAATMQRVRCKFQLVIKSTPAVLQIYGEGRWNVLAFDKKYLWTIKERNDRNATHLLITNYLPSSIDAGCGRTMRRPSTMRSRLRRSELR